jgi:translocator protein
MSVTFSILVSLAVCAGAAGLEGLFSGRNIKPFLTKLRMPRFSPSLFVWALIGAGYYIICFTILYRLLRNEPLATIGGTLILVLMVMLLNALWNYTFFRLENLRLSFILSLVYGIAAVALLIRLIMLDPVSALILLPYMLYMIYSYRWGYGLMKLNPEVSNINAES